MGCFYFGKKQKMTTYANRFAIESAPGSIRLVFLDQRGAIEGLFDVSKTEVVGEIVVTPDSAFQLAHLIMRFFQTEEGAASTTPPAAMQ